MLEYYYVRDLGDPVRRRIERDLITEQKCCVVGLQETKLNRSTPSTLRTISGGQIFPWLAKHGAGSDQMGAFFLVGMVQDLIGLKRMLATSRSLLNGLTKCLSPPGLHNCVWADGSHSKKKSSGANLSSF